MNMSQNPWKIHRKKHHPMSKNAPGRGGQLRSPGGAELRPGHPAEPWNDGNGRRGFFPKQKTPENVGKTWGKTEKNMEKHGEAREKHWET